MTITESSHSLPSDLTTANNSHVTGT